MSASVKDFTPASILSGSPSPNTASPKDKNSCFRTACLPCQVQLIIGCDDGLTSHAVAAQVGFCLPAVTPVLASNFNWTPVMIGIVAVGVPLVWYLPKFGARNWYHGKAHLMPDTSIVSRPLICMPLFCPYNIGDGSVGYAVSSHNEHYPLTLNS